MSHLLLISIPNYNAATITILSKTTTLFPHRFNNSSSTFPSSSSFPKPLRFCRTVLRSQREENDPESLVQTLRVPDDWLLPANALQESEWLRVTLHKWLDDGYCPEETNVEISKIAADSYYKSLVEKRTDLGEILLVMARDLESISYQESFHGAFSSANAAVNLIAQRIDR